MNSAIYILVCFLCFSLGLLIGFFVFRKWEAAYGKLLGMFEKNMANNLVALDAVTKDFSDFNKSFVSRNGHLQKWADGIRQKKEKEKALDRPH